MNYLSGLYVDNKMEFYYVLSLALLRGLLVPDFRFGLASFLIIQVAFPLALCVVFLKECSFGHYIQKIMICIAGIVLSELVSLAVYSMHAGYDQLKDSVSIALFMGSFLGQIVAFLLALWLLVMIRKRKDKR